jgi:hypothetical protein
MQFYTAIQSIWNDIPEYYQNEINRRKNTLEKESNNNS